MCAAAKGAVEKLGAKGIEISASKDRMDAREDYRDADCAAAIFSSEEKVKEYMSGAGLECKHCGFFGGPVPPKWIVVLKSKKGKSGDKIQEEAELSGRVCDGGVCFQSGQPIPVYTVEELAKIAA